MANKAPKWYLQTDKDWKNRPYRVAGETATIGGSGCGPACAAMLLTTLTGKIITPVDTCKWSVEHGYKAKGQGTYYSYFAPQFAAYGIHCKQLLSSRIIHQTQHAIHEQVKGLLDDGWYIIALMGPGLWTKSGHFIVVYDWKDKVLIRDPASMAQDRNAADESLFREQVRCYWAIDARSYNHSKEDVKMAQTDVFATAGTGDAPSAWAKEATNFCKKKGIFKGDGKGNYGWQAAMTREQVAQTIYNTLAALDLLDKLPDI